MADCAQIRPLLYQYLEREAGPAEAMNVARHLSDCTACKILMARKRRLARMLEEGLEDSIPVGDEFVHSLMATLPDGPPPRTRKSKGNRGLKLAAWVGVLVALGQTAAGRWPVVGGAWPSLALPTIDIPVGEGGLQGVFEWVRWAALAVEALAGGVAFELPWSGIGLAVTSTVALTMLIGLVTCSAVMAVATRSYLRSHRV